jgi:cytoskeletal protein CcmA (bactofilin family)
MFHQANRRDGQLPNAEKHPVAHAASAPSHEKCLVVGRGVAISGQIEACDLLVIEGGVDAKLSDCKRLQISDSGKFHGDADIETAEIAGEFAGNLTVRTRLTMRASGSARGQLAYREVEIEAGGILDGEVKVLGGGTQAADLRDSTRSSANVSEPAATAAAGKQKSKPD